MSTATLPRRKATRTKRGRPAASDYPLPFRELPLRLQEEAIESYRNSRYCNDSWDCDDVQEQLGEVLEYEFGITPEYSTYKGKDGKEHRGNPKVYWNQYNFVEFEVDDFDLDEVLKHADPAIVKTEGTHSYQPSIAASKQTLDLADKAASLMGVEVEWSLRLRHGRYSYCLAEYAITDELWDHIDTSTTFDVFVDKLEDQLKEIYEDACHRLRRVIEDIEAEHYSDEYIRDTLENNDNFEFDEEGQLV